MPTYTLMDADKMACWNLLEIKIPPRQDRNCLPCRCVVKLRFEEKGREEFLLVQVEEQEEGTTTYYGTLAECPDLVTGVMIGDQIQFTSDNVFSIIK